MQGLRVFWGIMKHYAGKNFLKSCFHRLTAKVGLRGDGTLRIVDGLAVVGMEFFESGFGEEEDLFADAFADVQE